MTSVDRAPKTPRSAFVAFVCALLLFAAGPGTARSQDGEASGRPVVRAIVWGPFGPRAWIDHNGERIHAIRGTRLDRELVVDEIRRETVICKRKTAPRFVMLSVDTPIRSRYHRDWSIWGRALSLWEALELVAYGFGHNVVMHHRAGATVIPRAHADNLKNMLGRLVPAHHRYAITGSVISVLPVQPGTANWKRLLQRSRVESAERLILRFPDLARPGTLVSRGDDIQVVLRRIALGGRTPISFPSTLHFPVYAALRVMPYFQILANIAYINGMMLIERENGIEMAPWPEFTPTPGQAFPGPSMPLPGTPMITAEAEEPQTGFGPLSPGLHPAPLPLEDLPEPPPVAQTPAVSPLSKPPSVSYRPEVNESF